MCTSIINLSNASTVSNTSDDRVKSILRAESSYSRSTRKSRSVETSSSGDSSCSTASTAMSRSSVQFETVEVREYNIVLGDNPICTGPPLSLGWSHNGVTEFPFDSFEHQREKHRRSRIEMKVPADVRRNLLRGWDVSSRSMLAVQLESASIRKQRLQTMIQVQRKEERKTLAKRLKWVAFCRNIPLL